MVFAEAGSVMPLLASDAYHRGHWQDRSPKRYGKMFLSSLPNCQQVFAGDKDMHEQIKEFYRKTHFMTK